MKNLWMQMDPPFVTWFADFTAVTDRPAAIQTFVEATVVAGAKHRICDVREAPGIGYVRARDGALADVLRRNFEREAAVDLFDFNGAAMMPGLPGSSTVETVLAYYDRQDQLVERSVIDVGELLTSLTPNPDYTSNGCSNHYPAICITGRRYDSARLRDPRLPPIARFEIHADVWFPWIFGGAHPKADFRRMFDNRELALRHTPRLNAFLAEVAEAARHAGGSFNMRADESATYASNFVTDEGVRLDWEPTDGVMPPEMLDVEWD